MDADFLNKLKAAFAIEAEEYVETLRKALNHVPDVQPAEQTAWLEESYRAYHSLKGASRAVDQKPIEQICMEAESVFGDMKKSGRMPKQDETDIWHEVVDGIESALHSDMSPENLELLLDRIRSLQELQASREPPVKMPPSPPPLSASPPPPKPAPEQKEKVVTNRPKENLEPRSSERMRISRQRMELFMRGVEELVQVKVGNEHERAVIESLTRNLQQTHRSKQHMATRLRQLERHLALETTDASVRETLTELTALIEADRKQADLLQEALEDHRNRLRALATSGTRVINNLQLQAKDLMLKSAEDGLGMLHRHVPELAASQNKRVQFRIRGGDIEVDSRILDGLKDAFLHIVRNAIDHGIEPPAERKDAGKPESGRLEIDVSRIKSGRIRILILDDGRGIDASKLTNRLEEGGIVPGKEVETWNRDQILDTVFLSGISTAKNITDISGRGLGMSIVREKVERLGGSARIRSSGPEGTTLELELPVLQTAFRGVVVQNGTEQLVIPTANVAHVLRLGKKDRLEINHLPAVSFQDKTVPLHDLNQLLRGTMAPREDNGTHDLVLILQSGNRCLAIRVDSILEEQEVLVKDLGPQIPSVRNISGIAMLATGELAPILHPSELMDAALRHGRSPGFVAPVEEQSPSRICRILVADDSFTSRMLLKNVLEAAGYRVEVVVDGGAAWAKLQSERFDIVISDVDMPRMDGFLLTRKIKQDRTLSETPVVLITSLTSQENRERGMLEGANAYITKSNFDQAALLDELNRLNPVG